MKIEPTSDANGWQLAIRLEYSELMELRANLNEIYKATNWTDKNQRIDVRLARERAENAVEIQRLKTALASATADLAQLLRVIQELRELTARYAVVRGGPNEPEKP